MKCYNIQKKKDETLSFGSIGQFTFTVFDLYNMYLSYALDVNIHDLILGPDEIVAVGTHWNTWVRDTFNAPVPFELAADNALDPVGQAHYSGNAWTDCVIALRRFSN